MAKFILVHGSGHGAWCWYKVVDRLQRAGHSVVAVDLTSAGINSVKADHVTSLEEYSRPLTELMEGLPEGEKVVLVGHSHGGIILTYVMELFPDKCAAAVFVSASMFPSGAKALELRHKIVDGNRELMNSFHLNRDASGEITSGMFKLENVHSLLYNLCSTEDIELAKVLLKPSPRLSPSETAVNFTAERYGTVPRFYIKAMQDKASTPETQQLYLDENPPDQVIEIPSDHSPFFSMPDVLVTKLLEIVYSLKKNVADDTT